MFPESTFVEKRKRKLKKSMVRAAMVIGFALGALTLISLKHREA